MDGRRQNALDTFLGKLSVRRTKTKLKGKYNTLYTAFMAFSVMMLLAHFTASHFGEGWGYWPILAISGFALSRVVLAYGNVLIDKPIIT